jgi:hypothetical protein
LTNTPSTTPSNTPTDTQTPTNTATRTPPPYQLNLSHIECVNFQTEVHFVLLNVEDGVTPGTLVYTYTDDAGQTASRSVSPQRDTATCDHYDYPFANGFINVTGGIVEVDGFPIVLHNPGEYAQIYNCANGDLYGDQHEHCDQYIHGRVYHAVEYLHVESDTVEYGDQYVHAEHHAEQHVYDKP